MNPPAPIVWRRDKAGPGKGLVKGPRPRHPPSPAAIAASHHPHAAGRAGRAAGCGERFTEEEQTS